MHPLKNNEHQKTSQQAQTLPDATPPIGKIYPLTKMAVTFEQVHSAFNTAQF